MSIKINEITNGKVFCKDCRHMIKPCGVSYEPHPESICGESGTMDYVTGEKEHVQCKVKNTRGICVDYFPK